LHGKTGEKLSIKGTETDAVAVASGFHALLINGLKVIEGQQATLYSKVASLK
jgi:hypothetical protein